MKKYVLPLWLYALSANAAWAEGQMKPGLWEMTMKSNAMKHMPKIPPEQMEQMRRMGMNVPDFKDGGMVSKVCVTPQMAARDAPGMDQMETGCQAKNMKRSGNSYSADIVCTGAAMKGNGKVSGSFSGKDRFSSTYDFKGTVQGQPVSHHQETSGRWLGADCGSVKPMGG
jgi:hypothetical protein